MTNDWRQPHQIKEDNFNQKIKYDDSLNKNEDNWKTSLGWAVPSSTPAEAEAGIGAGLSLDVSLG